MRTADLNLPIKKLIADKRIWAQGTRRATKYWPVTGDKAAVKKTTRAKVKK